MTTTKQVDTQDAGSPATAQPDVVQSDVVRFPPVSARTVLDCVNSTRYWVAVLPEYANDMQRRADRWAIFSGGLSAVGGLGVWLTISRDARTWAQFLVSALAFAGAIAALVPRVKSYGEMAGQARQLMTSYGRVEGLLLDAELWPAAHANDQIMRKLIVEFDAIKASKDTTLRHMPRKPVQPVGLQTDHAGIQTWPANTYEQAVSQMRTDSRWWWRTTAVAA